jgi:four helix bundle protein
LQQGKRSFDGLEQLRVYVLAEELSDKIWDEVVRWDRFARDTIGKQLVRATDSVGANIAESYDRFHPRDVVNFLYHARGSLSETKSWLRKAPNVNY